MAVPLFPRRLIRDTGRAKMPIFFSFPRASESQDRVDIRCAHYYRTVLLSTRVACQSIYVSVNSPDEDLWEGGDARGFGGGGGKDKDRVGCAFRKRSIRAAGMYREPPPFPFPDRPRRKRSIECCCILPGMDFTGVSTWTTTMHLHNALSLRLHFQGC